MESQIQLQTTGEAGQQKKVMMFYFIPEGQKSIPPPEFFHNACKTILNRNGTTGNSTNLAINNKAINDVRYASNIQTSAVKYHDPISLKKYSEYVASSNNGSEKRHHTVNKLFVRPPNIASKCVSTPAAVPANANTITALRGRIFNQNLQNIRKTDVPVNLPQVNNATQFIPVSSSFSINRNCVNLPFQQKLATSMPVSINRPNMNPSPQQAPPIQIGSHRYQQLQALRNVNAPQDCLGNIKIESIVSLAAKNVFEPEVILQEGSEEIVLNQFPGDESGVICIDDTPPKLRVINNKAPPKRKRYVYTGKRRRKRRKVKKESTIKSDKTVKPDSSDNLNDASKQNKKPSLISGLRKDLLESYPNFDSLELFHNHLTSCRVQLKRLSEPIQKKARYESEPSDVGKPVVQSLPMLPSGSGSNCSSDKLSDTMITHLKDMLQQNKQHLEKLRTEYEKENI